MNLSQACCLRPHSYISLWIKSRSRLSKMAADKKSFFGMKAFARLQNSARISHKKWPQRKGTSVREIRVFEDSPNRKLDLINEHTYAKCEFNSLEIIKHCIRFRGLQRHNIEIFKLLLLMNSKSRSHFVVEKRS